MLNEKQKKIFTRMLANKDVGALYSFIDDASSEGFLTVNELKAYGNLLIEQDDMQLISVLIEEYNEFLGFDKTELADHLFKHGSDYDIYNINNRYGSKFYTRRSLKTLIERKCIHYAIDMVRKINDNTFLFYFLEIKDAILLFETDNNNAKKLFTNSLSILICEMYYKADDTIDAFITPLLRKLITVADSDIIKENSHLIEFFKQKHLLAFL